MVCGTFEMVFIPLDVQVPKSRMSTNSIMPAWMSGRQRHGARQPLGTEKTGMHSINFILAFAVKKVNCTTGQKLV